MRLFAPFPFRIELEVDPTHARLYAVSIVYAAAIAVDSTTTRDLQRSCPCLRHR